MTCKSLPNANIGKVNLGGGVVMVGPVHPPDFAFAGQQWLL